MVSYVSDERLIGSMHQVIVILYAHNRHDSPRFGDLSGRDIAHPDMPDQPLLLEFGQNGERSLHRTLRWFVNAEHAAQVNYIQHIHSQVAKIVVNLRSQFLARKSRNP